MTNAHPEVLTIGHSTQSYDQFLRRLRDASVTAIADVRSAPFSRHFPHFNRDVLKEELRMDRIAYAFLGDELGGRPKEKQFFCDGVADYERMSQSELFLKGIERIVDGAKNFRIALMCSEHDPLDCHRCLLVGRALKERGLSVSHILGSGRVVSHSIIEEKLLELAGHSNDDFFENKHDRLRKAYRERARKVAFNETPEHSNSES